MLLHWVKSLFKDELWVFVHPQRMVLMRIARSLANGLKQQIVHKQVFDLPQNIALGCHESQDWQILTKHLKRALNDTKWQDAMPTVIVSSHFARYAVIPWNAELAIETERQAYMHHCFNLTYGESAKAWDLRMSDPDFGKSTIASAINLGLLQVLHDVFSEANMTLAGVYPQLMLAINQTLSEVKKQKKALKFWLVAIEKERVCLTLLMDGGWHFVKNVAIEADISTQVNALIQREIVRSNLSDDVPVLLYWPDSKSNQSFKFANHKAIKVLPHQFDIQNCQASNDLLDWSLV